MYDRQIYFRLIYSYKVRLCKLSEQIAVISKIEYYNVMYNSSVLLSFGFVNTKA